MRGEEETEDHRTVMETDDTSPPIDDPVVRDRAVS